MRALQAQFPEAQAVWSVTGSARADGSFERTHLLRTKMKYPLIRVEETWRQGGDTPVLVRRLAMVGDHLMVGLRPGLTAAALAPHLATAGASLRGRIPGTNHVLVAFDTTEPATMGMIGDRLRSLVAVVRFSEPDYIVHTMDPPNDAEFPQLWGMQNTGQTGGTSGCDISAVQAWDLCSSAAGVLVGVVDTGIAMNHPDLAANIWTNPGEIPGDGIDNDGNNFIDDVHGWDFVTGTNDASDDHYHGTHCAGTIGGIGGNGTGVAGVCWQVGLVPLKFLNAYGSGMTSDAVAAVTYATGIGCNLTSNSWGGGGYSQALKDAIDAAGASGSLFVAAAGNSSSDNDAFPTYPCTYDSANIIAVAATDHNDALAYFSCYGATTVDLAAPGVSIYSCEPGGGYQLLSGTSMAAPHVAGACALLLGAHPGLAPAAIKAALLDNTDPVPALAGRCISGGRLNLYRSVLSISGPVLQTRDLTVAEANPVDGLLNPGEDILVTATVSNPGCETALDAQAVLSCSDPAVTILSGSAALGDLPSGASAEVVFRLRLAEGAGTPYHVNPTLTLACTGRGPWTLPVHAVFVTSSIVSGRVTATRDGIAVSGALVSVDGTTHATAADGSYAIVVADGPHTVSLSASGWDPVDSVTVTTPPSATVDFNLGRSAMTVTPAALHLTSLAPTGELTVANPGDAPLRFQVAVAAATPPTAATGLWHKTSHNSVYGHPVWYYGTESTWNYDTPGRANSGTLTLPAQTIRAENPYLTFLSYRATESGTLFDTSLVQVSEDGGATWTTIAQLGDSYPCWTWQSFSLAAYAGRSVMVRFAFDTVDAMGNDKEGWYLDQVSFGQPSLDPWLSAGPIEGSVQPGDAMTVSATAQAGQLPPGVYHATISFSPVRSAAEPVVVPVDFTVSGPPLLTPLPTEIADPAGDGDGEAEPGETVTLLVPLQNLGTAPASHVQATLTSTSGFLTVTTGTADYGMIDGQAIGRPALPFTVTIAANTPVDAVQDLTCTVTADGLALLTTIIRLGIRFSSQVSGVITVTGTARPLADATVTANGRTVITAADGSYRFPGFASGSCMITATKAGYTSASQRLSFPGDHTWSPTLGAPTLDCDPPALVLAAASGSATASLTVANAGDGDLNLTAVAIGTHPYTTSGMWHRSANRSSAPGGTAWYYGNETTRTYDSATSTTGSLVFRCIAVPADDPVLTFAQWRSARSDYYSDHSRVDVSIAGGSWNTVWSTDSNNCRWEDTSVSLAYYAGKTVDLRFVFDSVTIPDQGCEGWYLDNVRIGGTRIDAADWLTISPASATIHEDGNQALQIAADTAGLPGGIYEASLLLIGNVPGRPNTVVPVTFTVVTPADLVAETAVLADGSTAPESGDGDAHAEPGEAIRLLLPLRNRGTISAVGVDATISISSPYVEVITDSTTYPDVPGLDVAQPETGFALRIHADCPDGTRIPYTVGISDRDGHSWSVSCSLRVAWHCTLAGTVRRAEDGLPLAGATITVGDGTTSSAADGTYAIAGIGSGPHLVAVSRAGYVTASTTCVFPGDQRFDAQLDRRSLVISPTYNTVSLVRGVPGSLDLDMAGSGSLPTAWRASVGGDSHAIALASTAGLVLPGTTVSSPVLLQPSPLPLGYHSAQISIDSNASDGPTSTTVMVVINVRSAHRPSAATVQATTNQDTPVTITLGGSDADGDPLTYWVYQPAHGAFIQDGSLVTYTPTPGFVGTDEFGYYASDSMDTSELAYVRITVLAVDHPPVAHPMEIAVAGATAFRLAGTDRDGDAMTFAITSPPRHGTAARNGADVVYTPAAGAAVDDFLMYTVSAGGVTSSPAAVILTAVPSRAEAEWPTLGNGPRHSGFVARPLPDGSPALAWTTDLGAWVDQVAVGRGMVFASSAGGWNSGAKLSALNIGDGATTWQTDVGQAATLSAPTLDDDGLFLHVDANEYYYYYPVTPSVRRYSALDGSLIWQSDYSSSSRVGHLAPTVADDRVYSDGGDTFCLRAYGREDGAPLYQAETEQSLLWTPTVRDGLVYTWVGDTFSARDPQTGAAQWEVAIPRTSIPSRMFTTAAIDAERAYIVVSDGYYGASAVPAIDLERHALVWSTPFDNYANYNSAPALANGRLFVSSSSGVCEFDTATGMQMMAYNNWYGGSSQPVVTPDAVIVSCGAGTTIFNRGSSSMRCSIPAGGHLSLAGSTLYIATSSQVQAWRWNRPPLAQDVALGYLPGHNGSVALLGADPDGTPLAWVVETPPVHGSVFIDGGMLTYTPMAGYDGSDSCQVRASDGSSYSAPVTVMIAALNRTPIASAVSVTASYGAILPVTLVGMDPDGDALTWRMVTPPPFGTATVTGDTLIFTAPEAGPGSVAFTVVANDGSVDSAPGTVTITFTGMPVGWIGRDVGKPGITGGTAYDPATGNWTLSGGGIGIAGTADAGEFTARSVSGDFDAIARIPVPATTRTAARIGLLLRDGPAAGAACVFVGRSGSGKVVWTRRIAARATAATTTWTTNGPTWVRLRRHGNRVDAYHSQDGVAWKSCGTVVIGLPAAIDVGLFTASGASGKALSATITGMELLRPEPSPPCELRINFQPGTVRAAVIDGEDWLLADGAPYARRWGGADYGFSAVTTKAIDRNSARSLDQRFDTLVNAPVSSCFEVGVPNGAYTVSVCVGDASATSGNHRVDVEGTRAITGALSSGTRWLQGTVDVVVADGRLTLSCGSGTTLSRWAWVRIVSAPVAPVGDG